MNELINDGGDCRTAPATPGLLIIGKKKLSKYTKDRRVSH